MASLQAVTFDISLVVNRSSNIASQNGFEFMDNGVMRRFTFSGLPANTPNTGVWGFPNDVTAAVALFKAQLALPVNYNGYPMASTYVGSILVLMLVPIVSVTKGDLYMAGNDVGLTLFQGSSTIDANYTGLSSVAVMAAVKAGYDARGTLAI